MVGESVRNDVSQYKCAVASAIDVMGGKWKPLILWHLSNEVLRFGELRRIISDISQKVLTQQLKELENDGLINRRIYSQIPPKVEYSLTELGLTVIPILQMISDWGTEYCVGKQTNKQV